MTITQYKSDTCFITLMQIRTDPPPKKIILLVLIWFMGKFLIFYSINVALFCMNLSLRNQTNVVKKYFFKYLYITVTYVKLWPFESGATVARIVRHSNFTCEQIFWSKNLLIKLSVNLRILLRCKRNKRFKRFIFGSGDIYLTYNTKKHFICFSSSYFILYCRNK